MPLPDIPQATLIIDVLQQFRVIYGSMRRHFREVEERCGLSGAQMWVLQEVERTPGLGVSELAARMGIHQSTCSLLVDKLVLRDCLERSRSREDQRRVGLYLATQGAAAIAALPGPAEGVLPEALGALPEVVLKTLYINLSELVCRLPGSDTAYASVPLADIVKQREPHGQ